MCCGGEQEQRVAIELMLSKWSIFSNLQAFFDLNGMLKLKLLFEAHDGVDFKFLNVIFNVIKS